MENIIHKILNEKPLKPSSAILNHFNLHYPNAINVEWTVDNDFYEAVFYENDAEKIVRYDKTNTFVNLKTNIQYDQLPSAIKIAAEKYGEIMNSIGIESEERIIFEIIYRDNDFTRFVLILNEKGEELRQQKL